MKNHCYTSTTLSILKIKKLFKQKNQSLKIKWLLKKLSSSISKIKNSPNKRICKANIKRRFLSFEQFIAFNRVPTIHPVNQPRSFVYSRLWIGCLWNFRAMKSFLAAETTAGGCHAFTPFQRAL